MPRVDSTASPFGIIIVLMVLIAVIGYIYKNFRVMRSKFRDLTQPDAKGDDF